jgi:hypothetical protein
MPSHHQKRRRAVHSDEEEESEWKPAPKRKRGGGGGGAAKKWKEQHQNMGTVEFMNCVRNKANAQLERSIAKEDAFDDLDLAVKTTRALIIANEEILQRCVESGRHGGGELVFKRVG